MCIYGLWLCSLKWRFASVKLSSYRSTKRTLYTYKHSFRNIYRLYERDVLSQYTSTIDTNKNENWFVNHWQIYLIELSVYKLLMIEESRLICFLFFLEKWCRDSFSALKDADMKGVGNQVENSINLWFRFSEKILRKKPKLGKKAESFDEWKFSTKDEIYWIGWILRRFKWTLSDELQTKLNAVSLSFRMKFSIDYFFCVCLCRHNHKIFVEIMTLVIAIH